MLLFTFEYNRKYATFIKTLNGYCAYMKFTIFIKYK